MTTMAVMQRMAGSIMSNDWRDGKGSVGAGFAIFAYCGMSFGNRVSERSNVKEPPGWWRS